MRLRLVILLISAILGSSHARAQSAEPRYYPVDHRTPGVAAQWNVAIDPTRAQRIQLVEIALPEGAAIASENAEEHADVVAPAQADLSVGRTYRFRISGLEGYPGVELFPSLELIDSLHAPPGQERAFPVPVEITQADIDAAIQNRLVTKVIYLEQSDIALPRAQAGRPHTLEFAPRTNLLKAADEHGRPIAILRLGGRQANPRGPRIDLPGGESVPLTPIGYAASRGSRNAAIVESQATPSGARAELAVHDIAASRPFPECFVTDQ